MASYGYDGLGHRIGVVGTDGVNRIQIYSQGGQMLQAGPVGAATRYIYLHNHVIAENGPGARSTSILMRWELRSRAPAPPARW